MPRELLIGAHMSIAGGIYRAFEHGTRAGCRSLQVFLKNNSQWKGKTLTEEDRLLYSEAQKASGISDVVGHGSYLINPGSPDPALWEKSLRALVEEMRRANFLGVTALVMHPGAHMGAGEKAGIRRIVRMLNRALDQVGPPVRLLLENTAGQGSCIGHRFQHLAAILDGVRQLQRTGVCLDTCHMFASGYDISTEDGYMRTLDAFVSLMGTNAVHAFHVNDSKKELGSRVDRHAHIGQGAIGLEAFRCLMNDRRFTAVPKVLETPKGKDLAEDVMNLATLRRLWQPQQHTKNSEYGKHGKRRVAR
jgi:deoxyribonuclease-4